jgi:hypothetical protein
VAAVLGKYFLRTAAPGVTERPGAAMDQRIFDIKRDIDETRSAMGAKLEMISSRIHNTILGPKRVVEGLMENLNQAKIAMQEATSVADIGANPTHHAVAETIERAKTTIHLIEQVKQDPWAILGSVLLMGYAIGSLNGSGLVAIRHASLTVEKTRQLHNLASPAASAMTKGSER